MMKQEVIEQSTLRAEAPAFQPTFTPAPTATTFTPELMAAGKIQN